MNIREISTARLREYENNPRNNDLAVEKVKYSIERFGFLFPVVVDMNYTIVCGHTRVRACREMGIHSVPCIIAEELTDEQISLFRLVDNKTSEYSDWDFEKLKNELFLVDLTLDKNQLLLDRFELSAEVFDIDAEQAEIKIPAFNFMGVNDKPKEKKPPVRTICGEEEVGESTALEQNVDNGVDNSSGEVDNPSTSIPATSQGVESAAEAAPPISPESLSGSAPAAAPTSEQPANAETPEKKESKAMKPFCQFRFGDVAFFISQVELDRLNAKYAEYIDSGAVLKGSFANYLLEGVENLD